MPQKAVLRSLERNQVVKPRCGPEVAPRKSLSLSTSAPHTKEKPNTDRLQHREDVVVPSELVIPRWELLEGLLRGLIELLLTFAEFTLMVLWQSGGGRFSRKSFSSEV